MLDRVDGLTIVVSSAIINHIITYIIQMSEFEMHKAIFNQKIAKQLVA